MRAMVFHERGGPEVLRIEEMPKPEPGPGEALVRVAACGLNRLDIYVRRGRAGPDAQMPHIGGSEAAGMLEALGDAAAEDEAASQGAKIGSHVAIAPYLFCGQCEMCLNDHETICLKGDIFGLRSQGGFAEYAVVPARSLVAIPDGISSITAAAAGLAMVTAWHMLSHRARLSKGESILVQAAGSGVGSAAIQFARYVGAGRIIATVGSDEKIPAALALGAETVINYRTTDVAAEIRKLTNKRGVDVVVEHVGADTWAGSAGSLARAGRLVTCGTTSGDQASLNLWTLFAKELSLLGSYGGDREEVAAVLRLIAQHQVTPSIDRVVPLEKLPEAQTAMEARQIFGKAVVTL